MTAPTEATLAVVIPYFQLQPGVLRKALASIAAQVNCPMAVLVIVVDDASPVPAAGEVAAITMPTCISVQVVMQANGGPGAARNKGLSLVPESTKYIAFLDSDDEWSVDHLERAIFALELGYDFYFADFLQLDQTVGAFARGGRLRAEEHPSLPGHHPDLHAYRGDMFDQILRGNVVGTPTVVYRRDKFGAARFLVEFTSAGEDYLFWMTLVTLGAKVAFSTRIAATCGRGVNVYAGVKWGTEPHLRRVQCELRYRKTVGKLFALNTVQQQFVQLCVVRLREQFILATLHMLRHQKRIPSALMRSQWRIDPPSYLLMPWITLRSLLKRRDAH